MITPYWISTKGGNSIALIGQSDLPDMLFGGLRTYSRA
jgi:hypothetical protein